MVITVHCPSCSTSFPVDSGKVPEEGVYARCSACSGVFFLERPAAEGGAHEPIRRWAVASLPVPQPETESGTTEVDAPPPAEDGGPVQQGDGAQRTREDAGPREAEEPAPAEIEAAEAPSEAAEDRIEGETPQPAMEPQGEAPQPSGVPAHDPPKPATPPGKVAAPVPAFTFGRRDPHEKARRLARVLVSDMVTYNPDRHKEAVASGSLKADFDEEIRKSWQEYLEQVGDDVARSTSYFNDALNEILAQGDPLFP